VIERLLNHVTGSLSPVALVYDKAKSLEEMLTVGPNAAGTLSGFIILSGDVVHLEESFDKNIVPSLNTNREESIASMEKVRQLIAMYRATLFINHDKKHEDELRLLTAFYD
jgi:hypothetical protein